MLEIWKDIKGYEGLYQISNLGKVKSLERFRKNGLNTGYLQKEKLMAYSIHSGGYLKLPLKKDKGYKTYLVHRLVALAFIDNPQNKRTINHKNGIKTDNTIKNLEWNTYSENLKHKYRELGGGLYKKGILIKKN